MLDEEQHSRWLATGKMEIKVARIWKLENHMKQMMLFFLLLRNLIHFRQSIVKYAGEMNVVWRGSGMNFCNRSNTVYSYIALFNSIVQRVCKINYLSVSTIGLYAGITLFFVYRENAETKLRVWWSVEKEKWYFPPLWLPKSRTISAFSQWMKYRNGFCRYICFNVGKLHVIFSLRSIYSSP